MNPLHFVRVLARNAPGATARACAFARRQILYKPDLQKKTQERANCDACQVESALTRMPLLLRLSSHRKQSRTPTPTDDQLLDPVTFWYLIFQPSAVSSKTTVSKQRVKPCCGASHAKKHMFSSRPRIGAFRSDMSPSLP